MLKEDKNCINIYCKLLFFFFDNLKNKHLQF